MTSSSHYLTFISGIVIGSSLIYFLSLKKINQLKERINQLNDTKNKLEEQNINLLEQMMYIDITPYNSENNIQNNQTNTNTNTNTNIQNNSPDITNNLIYINITTDVYDYDIGHDLKI